MSVYDAVKIGPVTFLPSMISADSMCVQIGTPVDGPAVYVEDGAIYIPVKLWEEMQEAARALVR